MGGSACFMINERDYEYLKRDFEESEGQSAQRHENILSV